MYTPKPIDTSSISLSPELEELLELLARNTHERWSEERIRQGWTWGPERDDSAKQHPGLVPYDELTEDEKEFDRITSRETLRLILHLGFRISR